MADGKNLAQQYDCLLIDLDGTAFRGHEPTEGAVQALAEARGRAYFVTNNASRSADEVAALLTELGFAATADDVATSAQSAARLLADQLPASSPVLIVGTEALANEITAVGLRPVRSYDDHPAAVVQGLSMTIGWPELAEAALAIRDGALWVAANIDLTLPTERGLLPGNGSLVAALQAATGAEPQVAGKPAPALLRDAAARGDFRAPLVIGDRLDTDIEGANAADLPSLMVLTGVNSARDAVYAKPAQRPTYIGHDLRSLHVDGERLAVGPQPGWGIDVTDKAITVSGSGPNQGTDEGDGLSIVRAVASAVWGSMDSGDGDPPVRIHAADDLARAALQRWSLVHTD